MQNIQINDHNESNSDSEINILVGADFYWDYMTGEIRRGKEGAAAIKTILGSVLNGIFQLNFRNDTSMKPICQ